MMSLTKVGYEISTQLGLPYDDVTVSRIIDNVKWIRSMLLRREIEKYGANVFNQNSITLKLEDVPTTDSFCIDLGCTMKKSMIKLPETVRNNSNYLLNSVSDLTSTETLSFIKFEEYQYTKHNKVNKKALYYSIRNNYIYVFNAKRMKYLRITAVFNDLEKLPNFCESACDCFTNDEEILIGADLIPQIKEIILKIGISNNISEINITPFTLGDERSSKN